MQHHRSLTYSADQKQNRLADGPTFTIEISIVNHRYWKISDKPVSCSCKIATMTPES
uniref:Uncharacterized protein n=1 Tax=Arundo donax TaxID=35708 RepID=A0A0A9FKK2_ARUDO